MPRYHFNVFDRDGTPDLDGTELPNHNAARREAIRLAGALLEQEGERLGLGEDWRMEVTDGTGLILFRLDFPVIEAPSTRDAHFQNGIAASGLPRCWSRISDVACSSS